VRSFIDGRIAERGDAWKPAAPHGLRVTACINPVFVMPAKAPRRTALQRCGRYAPRDVGVSVPPLAPRRSELCSEERRADAREACEDSTEARLLAVAPAAASGVDVVENPGLGGGGADCPILTACPIL